MRVAGDATLSAPVEVVWAALNDPDILARAIPGCERLEASGINAYRLTMSVAITTIKSTFTGELRVAELRESSFLLVKASAVGGQGTVEVDIAMRLQPSGADGTVLHYEADAVVAGLVAAVGPRVLTAIGKRVADGFLSGLAMELSPAGAKSRADALAALAAGRAQGKVAEHLPASSAGKVGLVAGGAVGLAGVVVGAILGRRHRGAGRHDG